MLSAISDAKKILCVSIEKHGPRMSKRPCDVSGEMRITATTADVATRSGVGGGMLHAVPIALLYCIRGAPFYALSLPIAGGAAPVTSRHSLSSARTATAQLVSIPRIPITRLSP
jgi:hypothetical protein